METGAHPSQPTHSNLIGSRELDARCVQDSSSSFFQDPGLDVVDLLQRRHFNERNAQGCRDHFDVLDECVDRIAIGIELEDLFESRLEA